MSELALYCRCPGEAIDLIVVYGRYTSRSGLPHLLAYLGGSYGKSRWRAEWILVERTPGGSVALVTEMGDWSRGHTFFGSPESPGYRRAGRRVVGPVDSQVEDRIYEVVNRWVYWEDGVLRLREEDVGARLSDGLGQAGPVDPGTIAELHSLWRISGPER